MFNNEDNIFEEDEIFAGEDYKLIFTTVKRGYEGEVLEAAKLAGHSGAVVMQAKSVDKMRKKFFCFKLKYFKLYQSFHKTHSCH